MIAGLGTGSTVRFLVDELGRRVQEEGLQFTGVTTSRRTQEQAESYGIKIVDIDDVDHIDVTIDGADEVDNNFNGIKGGGAALLWEKIVAVNSNKIVWIVDESKIVDTIGKFPLPVEVIPFGAGQVVKKFEARGYKPVLRLDADGQPVRTDENNYVVDLHLERIDHPKELAEDLITTVGVVEHGPVPQHGRHGDRRRPERPARADQLEQITPRIPDSDPLRPWAIRACGGIPTIDDLHHGHDGSESEKDGKDGSGTDTEKPRRILRGFLMLIELSSRLLALVTSLTQQFAVLLSCSSACGAS